MDEVDGMSAGDRGGIGALNALIKKTKVCRFLSVHQRGLIETFDRFLSCVSATIAHFKK